VLCAMVAPWIEDVGAVAMELSGRRLQALLTACTYAATA
jgi:hypothetical protein